LLELLAAKVARAVLRGLGRSNALRLPDRRLHRAEGLPVKAIARLLGISGNTVRSAVASDGPPKYVRKPVGSIVDAVEPRVRELLRAYRCPQLPRPPIWPARGGCPEYTGRGFDAGSS
jgi:hypothetical protein